MKKFFLSLLCLGFVVLSCNKNDDDPILEEEVIEVPEEEVPVVVDIEVQNFFWQTLNLYYFWQGDVPDLADDRFDTQAGYEEFLTANPEPVDFLENKLLFSEDRFTFYSDDYTDLVNNSAGVSKSNGLQFGLSLIGDTDDVFGYVEYIIKNSDASNKDIKRGEVFTGVNGTNLNRTNYIDLLFGDNDTYTLNMAEIVNNTISPINKEVTLTKQEGLREDPIFATEVITSGDKKIGYFMYNQFVSGSEDAMNAVFADFISQGVTDLVLDLRYNLGGRGSTATILASLIKGTSTSDLLFRTIYNAKLQAEFDSSLTDNYFVSTTGAFDGNSNAALNTLNLSQVYIIATSSSASASELVMVGLEPYINVVHIGSTTVGKNQGSLLFVDDPEGGNVYDETRVNNINPNVQWGLQPIISRVENSAGFSDYADGLIPDIELDEDITNLGVLGDANEPLLARAIQEITGIGAKRSFDVIIPARVISSSKLHDPRNATLLLNNSVPTSKFSLTQKK
ncbi:MAG: S41 family peptidase [Maribacter arcticus]|jgi:carboxyl-terminal processing protease|uniref:C-terminal processing protease CtpA/Prc, contains a PDZ domain n=1 Tax=Maribacter arcticus TaxID=561365 RepID=A0A1T5E4V9_9FLAO|nr:S41 family peptidase [Maribacter arcticus]SKB78914.1 C-terminal processing protease CtpA/Prc, contains a PDZ domain [Maribacter arcticus]